MEVNDSIFIPLKEGDNGNRLKIGLSQATFGTYGKSKILRQHFILRYRLENEGIQGVSSLEEELMSAHETGD